MDKDTSQSIFTVTILLIVLGFFIHKAVKEIDGTFLDIRYNPIELYGDH